MEYIFDNFKILIGLVVGVLWIIGKISEAKKKQQEQQQEQPWEPDDDDYQPAETYESEPPPIPYNRAPAPPPLPQFIPAPDEELQRQRVMHERLAAIRRTKTPAPEKKAGQKTRLKKQQALVSPTSIKNRLRDPRELRSAMVMREILDPPVSLR